MRTLEAQLETKQLRRMRHEDKILNKQERLELLANEQIGELCREGKTIYYSWPQGGRYYENASWSAVADRLIRNGWVG
jgi:hypothetical protein